VLWRIASPGRKPQEIEWMMYFQAVASEDKISIHHWRMAGLDDLTRILILVESDVA